MNSTTFIFRAAQRCAARLAAGITLAAASLAHAQEALRSSYAYDRDSHQNPVVQLPPDLPQLGPVQATWGVYTEADYDDNINLTQSGTQSDTILHAGLSANLLWPATEQTTLSLNTSVGYAHYLRYSENDSLEIAPGSTLAWNIYFADGWVSVSDRFSYSQSVVSEAALAGVARFPRFDNNAGVQVTWLPGVWLTQAGYSHDDFFSDSSEFNYLNRASEYFFVRGARRFAENTDLGIESSLSLTTYELESEGHNYSVSVGPFLDWQLTQFTRLTLRGGPTFYTFDTPGVTSQSTGVGSYYFDVSVTQQLTSHISHQLALDRSVSLGINQGSGYLEQLTAGYSISWSVTDRTSLNFSAAYEHGNQTFQNPVTLFPGVTILENENEIYSRYSFQPGVTWRATDHLTASLGYAHYLRTSSLADRAYVQNSVSLHLSLSF